MNVRNLLIALLVTFPVISYGQKSKSLNTNIDQTSIWEHIAEVDRLDADTNYIYSAVPRYPLSLPEKDNDEMHFPYPIIFIHGLVGSSDAWKEFYNYALNQGWSYGGLLLFNLNSDEDFSYSNIYSATHSDVLDFNGNLPAADFYLINFNCSVEGASYGKDYNTTSQSNQAAIVKQGLAIGRAVEHVLTATGKEKAILFGHSMGGLSARAYLQNPEFWPSNGQHHVAKLITSGTPHGGSNVTGFGLGQIKDIDEGSDAVRDLRRTYFYSGDPGVFLYGGKEYSSVMNDRLFGFHDYDVNCNGKEGESIKGLNQKDIPEDLDFACIIGDYSSDLLGGDLVVGLQEAQLKTYYNIISETFTINKWHLDLTPQTRTNYEALDEPDFYDLSYHIDLNKYYHGFISKQAADAQYNAIDYDDFIFSTEAPGWVTVSVGNIGDTPFGISVLGHPDFDYIIDQVFTDENVMTEPIYLPSGRHYLEFYAEGNSLSWQFPYFFRVDWSANHPTALTEQKENISIKIHPNPVSGIAHLTLELDHYTNTMIQLHNGFGQLVYQKNIQGRIINETIDMWDLAKGIYFLSLATDNSLITKSIVKE